MFEAKWAAFERKLKQGGNMEGFANCKLFSVAGEQGCVQREGCRGRRREFWKFTLPRLRVGWEEEEIDWGFQAWWEEDLLRAFANDLY